LSKNTFWITDGTGGHDDSWYIVKKVSKIPKYCNHCYKSDCAGFVSIGLTFTRNDKKVYQYEICNNCLYRPSLALADHNFIAVSKNKDPKYFDDIINNRSEYGVWYNIPTKNKQAYLELVKND